MDVDLEDVEVQLGRMDIAYAGAEESPIASMDALELIFKSIDGFHLAKAMQVCQVWQTVGLDEKLWVKLCEAEQVPVAGPRPTWFRTYTEFSAGSWRFRTSDDTRAALRAALPLLNATASPMSLFSWVPMQQPRWWQWGGWSLCNMNECLYIMSTIGCTEESPIPWLVVEVVANSNGWFRFAEQRVPVGAPVNIAWESNDIDDNEQPFEKPACGATVQLNAPLLHCGFYRGGIRQYMWDILVRPRQLFVLNPDGILEFRKNAMGFLYSDKEGNVLFPRPGKNSASSLTTWLLNQSSEMDEGSEMDEDETMHMEW